MSCQIPLVVFEVQSSESIRLMKARIPLTNSQKNILQEFYALPPTRVIYDKKQRDQIWKDFKYHRMQVPGRNLVEECPALHAELQKAIESSLNVQSAVFSECVYAQTLANMLGLTVFQNVTLYPSLLADSVRLLLDSYNLKARYAYQSPDGKRMLIQAGGHAGTDGALITVADNNISTIEFKEPAAKTSEPDLPRYGEDGNLVVDSEFLGRYPQFRLMLEEQLEQCLNFWNVVGTNVHSFSASSVQMAVSENFASKKFADVVCVEDKDGILVMLPANQITTWADLRGEIRPAGRNKYKVWTPQKLIRAIQESEGDVHGDVVVMPLKNLKTASPRGSYGVNRYKINSVFFVYAKHVAVSGKSIEFNLSHVQQLCPTISAHMFFTKLSVLDVIVFYRPEF